MDLGYSLLLREFVTADEVETGDCEAYQITCPACRDPVFKKQLSRRDGDITHFLSHYRAGEGDEKDCELRTSAIAASVFSDRNRQSRGQTLEIFLRVLKNAIRNAEAPNHLPGAYDGAVQTLLTKPLFRTDFAPYAVAGLRNILLADDAEDLIRRSIAGYPKFEGKSPFWQRRQAGYVVDVMQHLLAPKSAENMRYLAAAAFANIGLMADGYRKREASFGRAATRGYSPLPAVAVIEALVRGKPPATIQKIALRESGSGDARHKEEAIARMRLLITSIQAELVGPMIGILASVPFTDLISDHNAVMPIPDRLLDLKSLFEGLLQNLRDRQ